MSSACCSVRGRSSGRHKVDHRPADHFLRGVAKYAFTRSADKNETSPRVHDADGVEQQIHDIAQGDGMSGLHVTGFIADCRPGSGAGIHGHRIGVCQRSRLLRSPPATQGPVIWLAYSSPWRRGSGTAFKSRAASWANRRSMTAVARASGTQTCMFSPGKNSSRVSERTGPLQSPTLRDPPHPRLAHFLHAPHEHRQRRRNQPDAPRPTGAVPNSQLPAGV